MLDFNAQLLELVYWKRLDFSAICYCPQWLDRAVSDRGGHTCIIEACLKTGVFPSVKKRDPDCKAQNNSSEFLVVSWSPWVGWWKWPKLETPLSYWGTSVLIWAMTVNLNDLNPSTVLALEYLSINNTTFTHKNVNQDTLGHRSMISFVTVSVDQVSGGCQLAQPCLNVYWGGASHL